ncbi:M56 family metallopeptidase [Christiangramia sabulilitoris]|uniref:M56 family metallopeptidase n=1 Tax=Christiangramia sabulilitoris TaxID=2583991 RepID=UPI00140AC399|nr:M56 family metallopeptidase [Christiangramia sabulilitoris]
MLAILLISFILPLISFSYTVEVYQESLPFSENFALSPDNLTNSAEKNISYNWILLAYLLGLIIFAGRFISNLKSMFQEINENDKYDQGHYILVLMKKKLSPYSFLKYIFLNKKEFQNKEISNAIIEHEKIHVDQKHSLDLLFIEFLQIIFWFNPVFIWIKRSIKLNHEYLADHAVIKNNMSALQYSKILCNYSSGHYHNTLSSPMSQSLIKKRILMISKTFSFKKMLLKLSMLIPVLAICVYFFNNEIKANTVLVTDTQNAHFREAFIQDNNTLSVKIEESSLYINGKEIKVAGLQEHLDNLMDKKSDDEVREMGLKVKMINPEEGFVEKVNKAFGNSRIAKISGIAILPPPPPMPAEPGSAPKPPKAPKAPKAGKTAKGSANVDSERVMEIEVIEEDGEKKTVKKEIIKVKGDSPAPPPNPSEEIDKIQSAGGSFYYNDKKISAAKAKEILESKNDINIEVKMIDGGTQKMSISDN